MEPITATVTGLDGPIIQGDHINVSVVLTDSEDAPIVLTSCAVWLTIKPQEALNDTNDEGAIVACSVAVSALDVVTVAGGVAVVDVDAGTLDFTVFVPVVSGYPLARTGWRWQVADVPASWDVQVKDAGGYIQTVARGAVAIVRDVTRRSTTP